jgi:catechol 2,3-dioxygenase-like lactoylglutathione lyase family enzyme
MSDANIVFDHVHLISEDPQSTASWYEDKLGGKIIGSAEVRGAPQVLVSFEGATIIVRGQRPGEKPNKKESLIWGTDHFGFHVHEKFDVFCEDLKKKGVTFTTEPEDFSPSVRIAFIEDPDGVSIELLQRKG